MVVVWEISQKDTEANYNVNYYSLQSYFAIVLMHIHLSISKLPVGVYAVLYDM